MTTLPALRRPLVLKGVRVAVPNLILSIVGVAALVLLTVTGDVNGEVSVPLICTLVGVTAGGAARAYRENNGK